MILINDDCMDVMREFKDGHFDLAIVDPPYFHDSKRMIMPGAKISTTGVERNHTDFDYQYWQVPSFEYFEELIRVSRHQIIWGINYFDFAGLAKGGRIVWDKKNDQSTFSNAEIASCSMTEAVRMFRYTWGGMRQERMNWQKEEKIHPTQKPIALYEWLMLNYAESGQRILDTHMGSGSSAIAAANLGIDYTGIEIDPVMFDKAKKRIGQMTQQERLFYE